MITNIRKTPLHQLLEEQNAVTFMWDDHIYLVVGEEENDCTIPVLNLTSGIPDVFPSDFVPSQYNPQ